eukprot:scaffold1167_cov418-Prasinococcus_capsulatus_cf.AAC.13
MGTGSTAQVQAFVLCGCGRRVAHHKRNAAATAWAWARALPSAASGTAPAEWPTSQQQHRTRKARRSPRNSHSEPPRSGARVAGPASIHRRQSLRVLGRRFLTRRQLAARCAAGTCAQATQGWGAAGEDKGGYGSALNRPWPCQTRWPPGRRSRSCRWWTGGVAPCTGAGRSAGERSGGLRRAWLQDLQARPRLLGAARGAQAGHALPVQLVLPEHVRQAGGEFPGLTTMASCRSCAGLLADCHATGARALHLPRLGDGGGESQPFLTTGWLPGPHPGGSDRVPVAQMHTECLPPKVLHPGHETAVEQSHGTYKVRAESSQLLILFLLLHRSVLLQCVWFILHLVGRMEAQTAGLSEGGELVTECWWYHTQPTGQVCDFSTRRIGRRSHTLSSTGVPVVVLLLIIALAHVGLVWGTPAIQADMTLRMLVGR